MANNVDITYGFIDGVYQSAYGDMSRLKSRRIVIKYLTTPDYLEMLIELATNSNNKWGKCPYILHVMLWGLRNDTRKYNDAILQRMSAEQIAALKDAISAAKLHKCPDRIYAKKESYRYNNKKKTQKLSMEENVAWYSARIAVKVADNWAEMTIALDTWKQIIEEFEPSKLKARKIKAAAKNPRSEYRQEYYLLNRKHILEQKHLCNVCDDEKREAINAKRRKRYREHPESAKERSYRNRLAQPAGARKGYQGDYYRNNKDRITQKADERKAKLDKRIAAAKETCPAYILLMLLKTSKDKDEKKQYLALYTRKQEPLTKMFCPALNSMDRNLCPFCNPERGEDCNKDVLRNIADARSKLQSIANNLSLQK